MVGVVAWGNGGVDKVIRNQKPTPRKDKKSCNWYCHNQGCRHKMKVVGPPLAGPLNANKTKLLGLYGKTIDALHGSGAYRLANIMVFCLLWPLLTGSLWFVVVFQRLRLSAVKLALRQEVVK